MLHKLAMFVLGVRIRIVSGRWHVHNTSFSIHDAHGQSEIYFELTYASLA